LTMPFIEGTPLHALVGPDRRWEQRRAAKLVYRLALALHVLHQIEGIHRDLKPRNIMLRPDDQPMLMDFGLACSVATDESRVTLLGTPIGTPGYMPPELVKGDKGSMGPATDVYSLGAMLFELLTGSPPFTDRKLETLYYRILHEAPPQPTILRSDLDPDLEGILLRTLAKEPGERPRGMADLSSELEAYLTATLLPEREASLKQVEHLRAVPRLGQTLGFDPRTAVAYANRGEAYRDKGEYERAVASLDQALQLDPKYAHAYAWRGDV